MTKHDKVLTNYYGRLFPIKEDAEEWLERMKRKLGEGYTYNLVFKDSYRDEESEGLWSAQVYKDLKI